MDPKKLLVALSAGVLFAPVAHADPIPSTPRENETVTQVFDQVTNIPGKSMQAVTVHYLPGAHSAPHHHAKSAFIMAYVVSGAIRSQVDDGPVRIYHAGETWSEEPGAHHTVSENASATEPADLLAVFLVDSGDTPLTSPDPARG